MQGVINIYKEKGYTSFHAVAVLRHLTREKKIGHTGTLDPDVSGVLPICIGKATKLVGLLTDTDKTYKCVMQLGMKTDTQDMSGQVTETADRQEIMELLDQSKSNGIPTVLTDAFRHFTGQIEQIPPMYSAVKVAGVKLVDAARKGRVIERPSKHVTVYSYRDLSFDRETLRVSFTVECSKGTYVRTICEDIGNYIGIPACMYELERIKAAGLLAEDAITLDEARALASDGRLEEAVIPTDDFLLDHDYIVVTDDAVKRLIFGNYLYDNDIEKPGSNGPGIRGRCANAVEEGIFRVYDQRGVFYALYRYDSSDKCYKCEKMFA